MSGLYAGPIVDAHHHLWDLGMDRHPWLRPAGDEVQALGDLAAVRRNYLVADYLADAGNQNVVATVHVEAAWDRADDPLAEIDWLETLDKSAGVAARYIGYAPLAAPDASAVLDRLAAVPRCVGIRQMLSWHPTKPAKNFAARGDVAEDPDWRRGLRLLARHRFLLELMLYPYQADQLVELAREFPDQHFVINHCGSPIDRDDDGMRRWRDGLKRLGREKNISIKISAIAAYDPAPTAASLRDVAMHCIDCFGSGRAMFASDFPVGRLWTTFDAIFDGFREMVAGFSADEQRALFHDNARRLYRMDLAPAA